MSLTIVQKRYFFAFIEILIYPSTNKYKSMIFGLTQKCYGFISADFKNSAKMTQLLHTRGCKTKHETELYKLKVKL